MNCKGALENFRGMEMSIILILVTVLWRNTYLKNYQAANFIYVQFIIHQLYINKMVKKQKQKNKNSKPKNDLSVREE